MGCKCTETVILLSQGMVETGDTVSKTLKKEFSEEALCSQDASFEERERISEQLEAFFSRGLKVLSLD